MRLCVRVSIAGEGGVDDEPQLPPTPTAEEGRSEARALIADLRAGDESAYATVFHEQYRRLCNYAMSYLKSRDEARDIVQDVFVTLFVERQRLRVDEDVGLYLFGMVRNRALNSVRDAREHSRLEWRATTKDKPAGAVSWNDGESVVLGGEIADRVRQVVSELPLKCREAFVLVRMHGKTYEEAATILGVHRATVQSHLIRATKILGRQLGELGLIDGAVRPGGGKRRHGGTHAR